MASDTATVYQDNQCKNHLFYHRESSYVQVLSVNINFPIPADSVIIFKIELQELKKLQLAGVCWSMKDLEKRVNRKKRMDQRKYTLSNTFQENTRCRERWFCILSKK